MTINRKLHVLLTPEGQKTIDLTIDIREADGMTKIDFTAPQYIANDKAALLALIQLTHDYMEELTDEKIDIEVLIPDVAKYDEVLDILLTAWAVLDPDTARN